MICKFIHENEHSWDRWLDPLLIVGLHGIFSLRVTVLQEATGLLNLIK